MGVTLRFLARPAALRLSLWLLLLATIATTKADPDLWGHVRFGIDIIREGAIRHTDPYSFTSDRTWVNHEWAAEVITAAAHLIGGNAGLIILKLTVVLSVL